MSLSRSLTQCLAIGLLRIGLGYAQCESIFYTNEESLCYGMRSDDTTDNCIDIPDMGTIVSFVQNPVTEEFYVLATNASGEQPYDTTEPRSLFKFTASVEADAPVIDSTPVQIAEYSASTELLAALAFTCQGVPRLFTLTYDGISTQYLYEIDYLNSGNLTELLTFDISGLVGLVGNGLYYNIGREKLYRIAGSLTTAYEIDPFDIGSSAGQVTEFEWDPDNFVNDGWTAFASYYTEDLFFTTNFEVLFTFGADVYNATYYDLSALDDREGFNIGNHYIRGVVCNDFVTECTDTFSNAPSEQPSLIPSSMPSTDPSMMPSSNPSTMPSSMPSSDPSSMPTEMPVAAMMTTEDEVMDDTTMEPEATESSSDDPQPTLADSASKNAISFIMVFVAAFAYLFY